MNILLFHSLKESAGASEIRIPVDQPLHASELWNLVLNAYPGLEPYRKHTRMACNQSYVTDETLIYPRDEIALIPPVSGG